MTLLKILGNVLEFLIYALVYFIYSALALIALITVNLLFMKLLMILFWK